jgi:excinuclease ABC subunit A
VNREEIVVTGAREHNLRNISLRLPRNRLVVITGLSGSGKSSLAFDTLYAEGQRRYVESLSAYARQFLDRIRKPEVDAVEGLSPAIAIEQRVAGSNPRSIVATTTEIHDYLRLLYGHIGRAHCPRCGRATGRQSAEEITERILAWPAATQVWLLAPLVRGRKGAHEAALDTARKQGFARLRIDGAFHDIDELPPLDGKRAHTIDAVVDRLRIAPDIRARLADSVELALKHGQGLLTVRHCPANESAWREELFSEKNACAKCDLSFEKLTPRCFSFNSPYGACPACSGLGTQMVFDENLIVPDPDLSIEDGAIQAWRRGGRRLILYYRRLLRAVTSQFGIDPSAPFRDLPAAHKQLLFYGSGTQPLEITAGRRRLRSKPFEGIVANLQRRLLETESDFTRERLRGYMGSRTCPTCGGARLRPESLACTLGGQSIAQVTALSIARALTFFDALPLNEHEEKIAGEPLKEIRRRLHFLADVGLDYLTLDRPSGSLSGGETQRIRLATQIGSGLVGVLYVLDEPTVGLHARDTRRLIGLLQRLRDMGNTIIVVEHDAEMIAAADHVVDLGPGAGRHGGRVVFEGTPQAMRANPDSVTGPYLSGKANEPTPFLRKKAGRPWLTVHGAAEHNLADITVKFPLGLFVCVTGVSGSGKSTLVNTILKRALFQKLYGSREAPGRHRRITGMEHLDKAVVIDQAPIGRTPRSNPVTYTGAFAQIRTLFSATPAARLRGYGPGRFSFNVKGGRCETCKGDGLLRLEMHFLPDVYVTCERCRGARYNSETLEIAYRGRNIAETLAMTVDEAAEFFANIPALARKIQTLADVGLGYVALGQSATTLSGGEAQRVKLSAELARKATGNTLYLLDEPTTGLHFADIRRLMQVLFRLRDEGNTILVVEHNPDVIRMADYIVDLGPEGGDGGGRLVVAGPPETVAQHPDSHTGRFLGGLLP